MVDGSILNHFPFNLCKEKNEEKLGILIKKNFKNIEKKSNLINLYSSFFCNLTYYYNSKNYEEYKNYKNIIIYNADFFNKKLLFDLLNKKESRKAEIEKGYKLADKFIKEYNI